MILFNSHFSRFGQVLIGTTILTLTTSPDSANAISPRFSKQQMYSDRLLPQDNFSQKSSHRFQPFDGAMVRTACPDRAPRDCTPAGSR